MSVLGNVAIGASLGGSVGYMLNNPKIGVALGALLGLGISSMEDKSGSGGAGWGGGGGDGGVGPGSGDDEGTGGGGPGEGCSWLDWVMGACGQEKPGQGEEGEGEGGDQPEGEQGGEGEQPGEQEGEGGGGGGGGGEGEQEGGRVCTLPAGEPSGEETAEYLTAVEEGAESYMASKAGYEAAIPTNLKGTSYATYEKFLDAMNKAGIVGTSPAAYVWVVETERRYKVLDMKQPGNEGCRFDANLGGYHALVYGGYQIAVDTFAGEGG